MRTASAETEIGASPVPVPAVVGEAVVDACAGGWVDRSWDGNVAGVASGTSGCAGARTGTGSGAALTAGAGGAFTRVGAGGAGLRSTTGPMGTGGCRTATAPARANHTAPPASSA